MTSLSSVFLSNPRSPRLPNPSPKPVVYLPTRTRALKFSSESPPPEEEKKKSIAVATGELFLKFASRIINRRNGVNAEGESNYRVTMFEEDLERESGFWRRRKKEEEIAAVIEDPMQPEVVWEQTGKDLEAERKRKAFTSPGFSFSAAGLLFPYHLGVAKFLIERGYIKV
jgi:hypothetical protein